MSMSYRDIVGGVDGFQRPTAKDRAIRQIQASGTAWELGHAALVD